MFKKGFLVFFAVLMCLGSAKIKAEPTPLRVLSWNIYMLPRFAKITGKRQRASLIGELLKDSPYDVLVLQESFLAAARKKIRKELGESFPYEWGPANFKFSIKTNSGIWILSRYPMKYLGEIDFEECTGFDDCMARKGALMVELDWFGQPVQVLGTHLQAGGPHAIRHSQYAELRELLDQHARPGVPQLVCGDMNTRKTDSENYQKMLSSIGGADGELSGEQQFTSDGPTNDIKTSPGQAVIDYVLLRPQGVQVIQARRWVPFIRQRWSKRHEDLSDHFPVAMELTWNARKK